MNDDIKKAVELSNNAQRNYDLTKSIPQKDLDTLIYAAANSPSKQNETHYSLHVYTDQNIIKQIYSHTKKFTLIKDSLDLENAYGADEKGVFWQDDNTSVKNSQILANTLFVYVRESGKPRGLTSLAAQEDLNSQAAKLTKEQMDYSIGISVGQLILSSTLLGYKTGICSALDTIPIKEIIGTEYSPTLLVGVGYPNSQLERTQHAEVLNKDVLEKFRTGDLDEHWKFPTFKKYTKVTINGN